MKKSSSWIFFEMASRIHYSDSLKTSPSGHFRRRFAYSHPSLIYYHFHWMRNPLRLRHYLFWILWCLSGNPNLCLINAFQNIPVNNIECWLDFKMASLSLRQSPSAYPHHRFCQRHSSVCTCILNCLQNKPKATGWRWISLCQTALLHPICQCLFFLCLNFQPNPFNSSLLIESVDVFTFSIMFETHEGILSH